MQRLFFFTLLLFWSFWSPLQAAPGKPSRTDSAWGQGFCINDADAGAINDSIFCIEEDNLDDRDDDDEGFSGGNGLVRENPSDGFRPEVLAILPFLATANAPFVWRSVPIFLLNQVFRI